MEQRYQGSLSSTTEEWERERASVPDGRHEVTSKLDGATTLIHTDTVARVTKIAAATTNRRRMRTGQRAETPLHVAVGGLWLEGLLRAQARTQDTFTSTRRLAGYRGLAAKKGGTWRIYEYAQWMEAQKLLTRDCVIRDDDRERHTWVLTYMPREREVTLAERTERARKPLPALWLALPIQAFFEPRLKPIDLYVLANITEVATVVLAMASGLPRKILPPLTTLDRADVAHAHRMTCLGRDLWYTSVGRLDEHGYIRRQQHGRIALMPVQKRKTIFALAER